jgi:pimeloyl-ACP methyl ester carboxylesterase
VAQATSPEGPVAFAAPGIEKACSTYYEIIGEIANDLANGAPSIVYLHGGPGAGHEYLVPFAEQLWTWYSIPGVLYDQIGCASSTHLPEKAGDGHFGNMSLFIAELDNLLDHLHLRDGPGFDPFGQSWGGMLGADFATTRPRGLRRPVLASALASYETMLQGVKLLRAQLEPDQQATLDKAE